MLVRWTKKTKASEKAKRLLVLVVHLSWTIRLMQELRRQEMQRLHFLVVWNESESESVIDGVGACCHGHDRGSYSWSACCCDACGSGGLVSVIEIEIEKNVHVVASHGGWNDDLGFESDCDCGFGCSESVDCDGVENPDLGFESDFGCGFDYEIACLVESLQESTHARARLL